MTPDTHDLIVVGAGSGGIGAAVAAARLGLSVLLVEKADVLGGNAVRGGIHVWEIGCGGTGVPFDIYRRLKKIPQAVGVSSSGRHCAWPWDARNVGYPGGESLIHPALAYADTLRRHGSRGLVTDEGFVRRHWHAVVFEPQAYCGVVEDMLRETGRCEVAKNTGFKRVNADGRRIVSIELDDGRAVSAAAYVDGTADGLLALACGCRTMAGQESRHAYGEPSAGEEANDLVNAVTLIFRVTPTDAPAVEPLPDGVPAACWWSGGFPVSSNTQYPNGDFNINMLPTMEGREFLGMAYADAYAECRRRVRAYWHHAQTTYPEFRRYRVAWVAPGLGVRESRRVIGRYVLTERDLIAGMSGQSHPDVITVADHARDTHGKGNREGGGCGELAEPYGVPYRCLVPEALDNLLVACRAASFSSIAASSCRLSRTMMQLGQAAGTAAAVAKQLAVAVPDVPPDRLRQALRDGHAQVDWPMSDELRQRLSREDA